MTSAIGSSRATRDECSGEYSYKGASRGRFSIVVRLCANTAEALQGRESSVFEIDATL